MGEVIEIAGRRRSRVAAAERRATRPVRGPASFYFDLASPHTYLAAERVGRLFSEVRWVPVTGPVVTGASVVDADELGAIEANVRARAATLRLPLVWPDRLPGPFTTAMRVADYAAECGSGERFVLAASRLAFCGGFDLGDADVLAEAAAAAGLPFEGCLEAAGDHARDAVLASRARRLRAQGATTLPAVKVGRGYYCGEERLAEAAAAARGAGAPGHLVALPGGPAAG